MNRYRTPVGATLLLLMTACALHAPPPRQAASATQVPVPAKAVATNCHVEHLTGSLLSTTVCTPASQTDARAANGQTGQAALLNHSGLMCGGHPCGH